MKITCCIWHQACPCHRLIWSKAFACKNNATLSQNVGQARKKIIFPHFFILNKFRLFFQSRFQF